MRASLSPCHPSSRAAVAGGEERRRWPRARRASCHRRHRAASGTWRVPPPLAPGVLVPRPRAAPPDAGATLVAEAVDGPRWHMSSTKRARGSWWWPRVRPCSAYGRRARRWALPWRPCILGNWTLGKPRCWTVFTMQVRVQPLPHPLQSGVISPLAPPPPRLPQGEKCVLRGSRKKQFLSSNRASYLFTSCPTLRATSVAACLLWALVRHAWESVCGCKSLCVFVRESE